MCVWYVRVYIVYIACDPHYDANEIILRTRNRRAMSKLSARAQLSVIYRVFRSSRAEKRNACVYYSTYVYVRFTAKPSDSSRSGSSNSTLRATEMWERYSEQQQEADTLGGHKWEPRARSNGNASVSCNSCGVCVKCPSIIAQCDLLRDIFEASCGAIDVLSVTA